MSFRIFPNPVEKLLFISVSKGFMENSGNSDGSFELLQSNCLIRIFDILGRVSGDVKVTELIGGGIDISSLSNGTYFLQVGVLPMVRFQVQR
jgi:hypothetical protein